MKKTNIVIAGLILTVGFTACNGNNSTSSTGDSSAVKSPDTSTSNTSNMTADTGGSKMTTPPATSMMPLSKDDSAFVMKAGVGGMMEIESSKAALQNSQNDRVKAFANMMIADHTKASQELSSIAGSKGATPPAALPADKQMHIDEMAKMKGKAFDQHYMSMMVSDHKKTIADFEKEAGSGADADLKGWASKTLSVIKMHSDSATAISKSKM